MRKLIKSVSLSILLGVAFIGAAWAQTFNAAVNRTEVPQGETFVLTLELADGSDSGNPDLSVLDKDFIVYSVGNAFSYNYINGVASKSRQWQIALMPKNSGKITVPSIKLGNLETQPITLNVIPASAAATKASAGTGGYQAPQQMNRPKFSMTAEIGNPNPYVQQQVDYTLKIYDTGGLQGDMPQFIEDGSNNWIIRSLGEPTVGSKIVNGRSLREITFRYALFPQKSGVLPTPEVRFNGYYLTRSRGMNDPFDDLFGGNLGSIGFVDMFATRNPVLLTAKPEKVNVQPIPSDNNGNWWLPAQQVALFAEWEPRQPVFKVGEAVNRTIYLKAVGVAESQLPELNLASVSGLKQYPDKAVASSGIENGQVVAVKKISNVYIPNRAGKMTIPEIAVNWFNVRTNRMEKAVLPAMNIEVLPGAAVETAPAPQPETRPESPSRVLEDVANETENLVERSIPQGLPYLPYIIAAAAFLLGIVVSWMLFGMRNKSRNADDIKDFDRYIVRAAKSKDYRALRDGLISWARDRWNDSKITNLKDVAKAVGNKEFAAQLDGLAVSLYAPEGGEFKTEAFLKAFEKVRKAKVKSRTGDAQPLPKLYK
uniref:BatD family protein n=2 Tax=Candidatus Scatocola faecipullorum TaxID=2840917 RepID=UPI0040263CE6